MSSLPNVPLCIRIERQKIVLVLKKKEQCELTFVALPWNGTRLISVCLCLCKPYECIVPECKCMRKVANETEGERKRAKERERKRKDESENENKNESKSEQA
ncbi:hypothetical protein PUN28_007007 [Cardiocondyla obscurior]|uniref:Uncharacterized protein n=1 Tax=Cardiocondyla obscurior TaxID=286306 RepID=A0AAW2G2Y2_9HYME